MVADREHFVWLADRLEGHLQKPIGAERPMDAAFCELSDSHHTDLSGGGPRGRGNRLAAHSFKATLITWSGWCPVPTFTLLEQQLMGHHVRRAREPGWTASLESDPFTLPPPSTNVRLGRAGKCFVSKLCFELTLRRCNKLSCACHLPCFMQERVLQARFKTCIPETQTHGKCFRTTQK